MPVLMAFVGISGDLYLRGYVGKNPPEGSSYDRAQVFIHFTPTFEIMGIPLRSEFLLTDFQSPFGQTLNRITLSFQGADLQKAFERRGKSVPRVFLSMRHLSFGATRMDISDFTARGLFVKGLVVEMTPGPLFVGFMKGNSRSGKDSLGFGRDVLGIRLGIGAPEKSHGILTVLKIQDDTTMVPPDSLTPPQANLVVSFQTAFHVGSVTLEAEGGGSVLTRDIRDATRPLRKIPEVIPLNLTSSGDFALRVRLSGTIRNLNLTTYAQMVGPGYVSLGSPSLQQDQLTGGLRLAWPVSSAAMLTFWYEGRRDNLLQTRVVTTQNHQAGFHANMRLFQDMFFGATALGMISGSGYQMVSIGGNVSFRGWNLDAELQRMSGALPEHLRQVGLFYGHNVGGIFFQGGYRYATRVGPGFIVKGTWEIFGGRIFSELDLYRARKSFLSGVDWIWRENTFFRIQVRHDQYSDRKDTYVESEARLHL